MTIHARALLLHTGTVTGIQTHVELINIERHRSNGPQLVLADKHGPSVWAAKGPWPDFRLVRDGSGRCLGSVDLGMDTEEWPMETEDDFVAVEKRAPGAPDAFPTWGF